MWTRGVGTRAGTVVTALAALAASFVKGPSASAQRCRTDCPRAARDQHGCCPAAEPGGTSGAPSCTLGREVNADTAGHCCWPGQAWSSTQRRCVGEPRCPDGFEAHNASCACPAGMQATRDTQDHCCWSGQAWSSANAACVGRPSACPRGMVAGESACSTPQQASGDALAHALTGLTATYTLRNESGAADVRQNVLTVGDVVANGCTLEFSMSQSTEAVGYSLSYSYRYVLHLERARYVGTRSASAAGDTSFASGVELSVQSDQTLARREVVRITNNGRDATGDVARFLDVEQLTLPGVDRARGETAARLMRVAAQRCGAQLRNTPL